ncbi:MAG: sigma-70 family RNA polymerase sigma factor [Clostridia bacterium]|nr:sigma-70 family RNA polymerase sigma factor [Clostridia bacterium]
MNQIDINSILNRAQNDDESAIEILTKEFSNVISGISRSYFIYGGDSDDLYQIGLIGFYDAIKKFDSSKNTDFIKFAKICIHSKIIDAIKEANRKKHSPLNTAVGIDSVNAISSIDPEKRFIVREQLLSVYSAIDFKLSDYEKAVLNLFIDGLSYKEIASRMGTSVKSVNNAIVRIRNKLV